MENILTILTFLFGLFKLSSEIVITTPSVVGMKDSKVDLGCRYQSTAVWYVIQWKRLYPNMEQETITTLKNDGKSSTPMPIWEGIRDESFRTRVRTSVYVDVTSVDFTISIHDFSCNDTGVYVCQVVGSSLLNNSTNLTIAAKPGAPRVIDDEVILEENDTYTLECIATAGIPVADLRWYYKIPGSSDFVRIDTESEQELLDIDDCSQKAIQKIDVIVNPETDGIIYRCKVESNLLDDEERNSFYDDVLLKLPIKVIPQPEYRMPQTKAPIDPSNRANSISGYLTFCLMGALVILTALL
ncbi:Hypothetical predicted protein [Mytilus galloprovincialis]|uniref:Ig-like domain-containing protein n=1 Tax=Mytilus galloprovincialis TaxID=29158 RepID=A0A8B6BXG5_MYTGA|nr:Hypothetical predicted protein [Mytilus galloprovincialis]